MTIRASETVTVGSTPQQTLEFVLDLEAYRKVDPKIRKVEPTMAQRSPDRLSSWTPGPAGPSTDVRRAGASGWHPQRDSNPCYLLEREAS